MYIVMEYYSGSRPNLIGPIMKATVNKAIKRPAIGNTISDKVTNHITKMYNNYVVNNKIPFFVCLAIISFLVYRYHCKKTNEQFNPHHKKKAQTLPYTHLQMNPTSPIDHQDVDIDIQYPPDPLPINLGNREGKDNIVYTRDIFEHNNTSDLLNDDLSYIYDHNNVYNRSSLENYHGLYNTYQDAKDTDIPNPFGWSNDFNTNTGHFVSDMTDLNAAALGNYQKVLDTTRQNLFDGATLNV